MPVSTFSSEESTACGCYPPPFLVFFFLFCEEKVSNIFMLLLCCVWGKVALKAVRGGRENLPQV